jgi:hypothetical protein
MLRTGLLALYATALVFGQTQPPTNCDSTRFQACTFAMAQFIGVDTTSDNYANIWRDYTLIDNYFRGLFTSNIGSEAGLVTVCNARDQFLQCLGNYRDLCTSLNSFFARGLPMPQPYSFVGLLQQYQYYCGTGFYTAIDGDYACLQRVALNFNSTLQTCVQTYQTNVLHDPSNACTYASDLLQCHAMTYNTNCQRTGRIDAWWACEAQRQFVLPQFPNCGLSCNLVIGTAFDVYQQTHHKIDNGQHWYKMPDVFVKVNNQWQLQEGKWMSD